MSHQRHIVLIHRYFYPDTPPYASILREIALALGEAGHRVTVLTCKPSYNRKVVATAPSREVIASNVTVRRWPVLDDRSSSVVKLINLLGFAARLLLTARRLGDVDRVMAASTPPVLLAAVARMLAAAKRAGFIYHHQDIYPEVALSDTQADFGLVGRIARAVDSHTDRRAARVVVLSRDMAGVIRGRGVQRSRIEILNNFDPWQLGASEMPRDDRDGPLRVVYAGNLGRFQNLDALFSALMELRGNPNLRFEFFGEGGRREELEELIETEELHYVRVHGHVPPEQLAYHLRHVADLGIVTLNPGLIRSAYPSKTLSYLRNGLPVLVTVERDSELSERLEGYGAGWTIDPSAPATLSATLAQLAVDPAVVRERRNAAQRMYEAEFGTGKALPRWVDLLAE